MSKYPFPLPESIMKELSRLNHPPEGPTTYGETIRGWTPEIEIPLHLVSLSTWEDAARELVKATVERIKDIPHVGSERHRALDLLFMVDTLAKLLDGLNEIIHESYLTLPFDPVVRDIVERGEPALHWCMKSDERQPTTDLPARSASEHEDRASTTIVN